MKVAGAEKPTKVRWAIMACLVMVTTLTIMDRLNLGISGKFIQDELKLSTQMMGWVFSAFLLGYSLFQVPAGWVGDRYGPKNVLTGAILLWSLFTALCGFAPDLVIGRWIGAAGAFIVVRFLVGVGEAANAPNSNKIVSNWIGSGQRGIGSSFLTLGIGIGGTLTPPLIAWIAERWGWRFSFYISGLLGLFVVLIWEWYVTNTPNEHPKVNAQELSLIQAGSQARRRTNGEFRKTPWKKMLSNRSVWGILLGYMCQGFPIYFFHTWFFIYLVRVRHLSISEGGMWGSTPFLAVAIMAPLGGWFSDVAVRRFGKRNGRRIAVFTGMLSSALLIWVGAAVNGSASAVLLLALGGGLNMFAAVTYWATCIDLTNEFAGSLSGMMNTLGNLGGWLSPVVSAYLATHYSWKVALDCAAVVTIASALFFLLVRADQKLDQTEEENAGEVPDLLALPVS
jgi:ACS family glucarate transporter-like MFS transporter